MVFVVAISLFHLFVFTKRIYVVISVFFCCCCFVRYIFFIIILFTFILVVIAASCWCYEFDSPPKKKMCFSNGMSRSQWFKIHSRLFHVCAHTNKSIRKQTEILKHLLLCWVLFTFRLFVYDFNFFDDDSARTSEMKRTTHKMFLIFWPSCLSALKRFHVKFQMLQIKAENTRNKFILEYRKMGKITYARLR